MKGQPKTQAISEKTRRRVLEEVKGFVDAVIERRVIGEPFDEEAFAAQRPFHAALAPMQLWKAARFERSFVTSLGQRSFERIAHLISSDRYESERSKTTEGRISNAQLATIQRILDDLERRDRTPDWEAELALIDAERDNDPDASLHVISDLWVKKSTGEEFYEIKSSKPNSDQSKVSKEKMLKLYALDPTCRVYFALPDNPYVTRQAYGWTHPMRWFDMRQDPCVLIGRDFWDNLGGQGTYDELLNIFREVGKTTKPRIRREVLGLDD
ncbi:MAG: TdeIII family type II restriction endonuclease [Planctomycetes bacterium]|nr:TdeIII family type II restriction endonuclease [Planctomycetota bacterium]